MKRSTLTVTLCIIHSLFYLLPSITNISVASPPQIYHLMNTVITNEVRDEVVECIPTLYGDGNMPLAIIYTHYTNIYEMNKCYIVDFVLWKNGKVIWNKGNHDKVDYYEILLSKEELKHSIQCLKQVIPWRQQLEFDLSLEGFPTTTFVEIDGECFYYHSEQCFETRELAWTSSSGWVLYAKRQIENDFPFRTEAGEEVNKLWTPPRPLNAISLTNRIRSCFPLDNSKQVDIIFFPESISASMRIQWEEGITRKDAMEGKWQPGTRIRYGSPWWNTGSPYWDESKEKAYIIKKNTGILCPFFQK